MDKILGGQRVLYEPKGQNQWPQQKPWRIRCLLRVRNISQWAQGPQQRTDASHWSPHCIVQLFNKHFLVPTDCQGPNYADAQQRKCISCLQGLETSKEQERQERQERQDKNTNNFNERLKVTNTSPAPSLRHVFLGHVICRRPQLASCGWLYVPSHSGTWDRRRKVLVEICEACDAFESFPWAEGRGRGGGSLNCSHCKDSSVSLPTPATGGTVSHTAIGTYALQARGSKSAAKIAVSYSALRVIVWVLKGQNFVEVTTIQKDLQGRG